MDDLISRRAVLALPRSITRNMKGEVVEESIDVELIKTLPSAQPNYTELAQTVERWYNKALTKPYIKDPLAWALKQSLEGGDE